MGQAATHEATSHNAPEANSTRLQRNQLQQGFMKLINRKNKNGAKYSRRAGAIGRPGGSWPSIDMLAPPPPINKLTFLKTAAFVFNFKLCPLLINAWPPLSRMLCRRLCIAVCLNIVAFWGLQLFFFFERYGKHHVLVQVYTLIKFANLNLFPVAYLRRLL